MYGNGPNPILEQLDFNSKTNLNNLKYKFLL